MYRPHEYIDCDENTRLTVVDGGTRPLLRVHTQFRDLVRSQRVIVFILAVISVVAPCQIEEIAWRRFFCENVSL